MHALVINNEIVKYGKLPTSARHLETGDWVLGTPGPECGWYLVVDAPRPENTETTTYTRNVELVDGQPTMIWVERPKTEKELVSDLERNAPDLTETIAAKLTSQDNTSPKPWKQPEGAHDAYLPGAIVTDGVGGEEYRNDLSVPNVWGLSTHGWVLVNQPTGPQPWVQPTGAHDAYNIGDQILWTDDLVYASTIDANTYSPATYPAGWQVV